MTYDIFIPVFVLIFWTLIIPMRIGLGRKKAVAERRVDPKIYKVFQGDEPEDLALITRHFHNLLELPILFYLWAIMVFITGTTNDITITLAWVYVVLRMIHAVIHLGSNNVLRRFQTFAVSWLVLLLSYGYLVYALYFG